MLIKPICYVQRAIGRRACFGNADFSQGPFLPVREIAVGMNRFLSFIAILVVLAAGATLPATALADTTQIDGVTITASDTSQLLKALHTALQPNDATIPMLVSLKAANEMPAYDQVWHYDGLHDIKGVQSMSVWFNKDLKGSDLQSAIETAFLLALCDGGYGGTAFKQLYDLNASRDAQLPSGSPDPFLNRHKLAALLLTSLLHGGS